MSGSSGHFCFYLHYYVFSRYKINPMTEIKQLSIVLLFSIVQCAFSQMPGSGKYVVSHWGMEEGLPQSSVNDILQTKDGYLWLATFGGLVRFDGVDFTTFNRFNTKGMRSDRILSLYEDRQGALWLCTEDGFLRFHNGECSTFLLSQESQIYAPDDVAEDSRGVIWLSVHGKPYRFSNGTFVQVPVVTDTLLAARAIGDQGGVWIAHGREILRTIGDSVVLIKDLKAVLKNTIKDFIEFPAHSGVLFLGTNGDGVVKFERGSVVFFTERNGLPSKYIWKLYVDRNNTLWVNSFDGISTWNGTSFAAFKAIRSTKDIQYNAIHEDTEGDYWIGTPSQGLYKVRPSIVTTISASDGLWNDKMLSLSKLQNGTVLFATNCGGIYEWKNGKAALSSVNAFLPNLCVWSVFEDSKRNIWFGSRVLYRSRSLTSRGIVFDSTNGFQGVDIFAITEDSHNNIWIGCFNGVFVYDGKKFRRYSTADGLSYNDTRVFFEDKNGAMWIGTSAGLNVYRDHFLRHIDLFGTGKDTVRSHDPYIRAIYEDAEGTMWFGSYGDGLIRMKNGKISFITTRDGMFDNIVSHIVEDTQGNFWMGSNRGISRVNRTELNELCDGLIKTLHAYSYNAEDGMKSAETNGGFQPSVIHDSTGDIFFPTVSGVAIVSTGKTQHNTKPPPVRIERLLLDDREIPVTSAITLPYDSAYIEIRYTALSFPDPNKVQFKYRLEGLNNSWFDAKNRKSALYSKIPPGEYRFHVIACNNDGVWNTAGASLDISILPPFWMTWWFRTAVILFFLAAGPLVYYFRITQLKKEKTVQDRFAEQLIASQEQERRRIAAELHDGLGQQILIIKNRAELALKTVADPVKTEEQLREISGNAVRSMNDVRTISHDLRPVYLEQFGLHDTLENLCEQIKKTSSIACSFYIDRIDGIIPAEKEINFYRIVQEGINNILKHSMATEATFMVRKSDTELTVSLWDNGRGFDMQHESFSTGLGLQGIQERAKTLGGLCDIKSQPGEGTTIMVIIPVHQHG
jgi:signal transduction histidine kinase/ligand-binding sensor domain-containing protein